MSKQKLVIGILSLMLGLTISSAAHAKSPRPTKVTAKDLFQVAVSFKEKKKLKKFTVNCLSTVPGEAKKSKKFILFTPYSYLIKQLQSSGGSKSLITRYKSLNTLGAAACKKSLANGGGPAPTVSYLSLDKYTGTFGPDEARALYDRFAFGGTPEQIQQAVTDGLDKTVTKLMTYVGDPAIDAVEASLRCDGRMPDDPQKEQCDPTDPNDLYTPGFRYGILYRWEYTQSPFFEKLFMFFHDERLSASSNALDGCENYALPVHVNMIRNVARTGDYTKYMRDFNNDVLGHLLWLDGGSNHAGIAQRPNENYAREFWELGTVGASDLGGNPNYSDLDIAQSALAFSGWDINYTTSNGHGICLASRVPLYHANGNKTIFNGTSYQATVENDEDVLKATFAHPRTAESLAQDIWKEFINPLATGPAIKVLAADIRANNYMLLPTIKKVMSSQAMFAPESRKSLIKHPVDLLVGFIRTTKIPVDADNLDNLLSDLGELPLQPPTVFGWDEKKLAGESHVLDWRNTVNWVVSRGDDTMKDLGFSYYDRFLASLPHTKEASDETMDRVTGDLGITLTAPQRAKLKEYMDFDIQSWDCPAQCGGQPYKVVRNAYDSYSLDTGGYKLRGILNILATLPQYRMK